MVGVVDAVDDWDALLAVVAVDELDAALCPVSAVSVLLEPVVPVDLVDEELTSDVFVELACVSLSSLVGSLLLTLDLSDSLSDDALLESDLSLEADDVLETELVTAAPSLVLVALLTTTLVAPNARTIDTIANGVRNGGVR